MISVSHQCSQRGMATLTSFLAASVSEEKILGLISVASTWKWRLSSRFLVGGIVWRLDLLQGENPWSAHVG
jgi:hypothetical protein